MSEEEFTAWRARLIASFPERLIQIGVLLAVAAWLTSLIHDAIARELGWIIVAIVVFPIGILRGLLIWLGLA